MLLPCAVLPPQAVEPNWFLSGLYNDGWGGGGATALQPLSGTSLRPSPNSFQNNSSLFLLQPENKSLCA